MEVIKPVHVVGIGSPHGDDQVGWQAIAHLQQSSAFQQTYGNRVVLHTCATPLDGFLEHAKNSQALIVIDAVVSGAAPGTVMRLTEDELPTLHFPYSSHGYSVVQMIALGRAMNMLPPYLVVLGIEISDFDSAQPLEETVFSVFKKLEKHVVEEIESLRAAK